MAADAGSGLSADEYSRRHFGAPAFAAFDPASPAHRAAAGALHDRLVEIGFGPDRAAGLFAVDEFADIRSNRAAYYDAVRLPADAAGAAARFFVLHLPAAEDDLRTWLGAAATEFLIAMAAIVSIDGQRRSLVSANWFANRLIFADARAYNAVWPAEPFADYVMPPGRDSVGLERVAPRTAGRSTLDLCCGAGAQTLAAASYSQRVTGADLNPRALRFANFNAAVNRVENASFVLSDVYDGLPDERFDAIVANPPFVPWPAGEPELLFRGGGARGEDVVARILAGAVTRLQPHGSLTIVADFADAATLGERIQTWQGEPRRTLILLQHRYDLSDYAETHAAHLDDPAERRAQTLQLVTHFQQHHIHTLDFGYIVQDGSPGPTCVIHTTAAINAAIAGDVAAWFAHQRLLYDGNIADLTLRLAPDLRLIEVRERNGSATRTQFYVAPGTESLHESRTLSPGAFALLTRIATGELRVGDLIGDPAVGDLTALLREGVIRTRPRTASGPQ